MNTDAQILAELSTALQWISRLQTLLNQVAVDTAALRISAHNHTLSIATLDAKLSAVLTAVNHSGSGPDNLAPALTALATLDTKVTQIMATEADLEAALASSETAQGRVIALLTTQADSLTSLSAQLAAAIANGSDPAVLQALVDKMTADAAAMNAAADAHAATPPSP